MTVFRSRLRADALEEYGGTAAVMSALAADMPGYVEHKVFTAEDGERVTLVTFADRDSHDGWRTHAEHRVAQRRGREAFYDSYSVQVADVTSVRVFPEPGPAGTESAATGGDAEGEQQNRERCPETPVHGVPRHHIGGGGGI